jgi:hypothetical protein
MVEKLSKLGRSADFDSYMPYNSIGVSSTYEFIVVVCSIVAMSKWDHEQLAVTVE